MTTALSVDNLFLQLPDAGLHGVSLSVAAGECLCVMGPTGAGKTVLLETIAGIRRPDRGCVRLSGRDVTRVPAWARGIAYVPQDGALFPHLTVAQNVAYGLVERRLAADEISVRVAEATGLLGVDHLLHRLPAHLSGGEKQRVALARALVLQAPVMLLDEPFAAVDERNREGLGARLRDVCGQQGTAVVHVSHSFDEALAVADRITVLHDGRVLQTAAPDDLLRRPSCEFVAAFTGCCNILAGEVVHRDSGSFFVSGEACLQVQDDVAGEARLVIRPEDVRLSPLAATGRANTLTGEVSRISPRGATTRVEVRAGGVEWTVSATRREAGALVCGMAVAIEVPAAEVHLIR